MSRYRIVVRIEDRETGVAGRYTEDVDDVELLRDVAFAVADEMVREFTGEEQAS